MTKIIYLDQNHWINLLRTKLGISNQNQIEKRALNAILKASKDGSAIFPISNTHLIETYKKKDSQKREQLLDFMIEISNGYGIVTYIAIQKFEIRQAVLKQVGLPTKDIRQYVIGKGFPYIMGQRPEIINKNGTKPNFSKEINDKIKEATHCIETFKLFVKNNECIEAIRNCITKEKQLVKNIEDRIKRDMNFVKDKDLRKRFTLFRLFYEIIIPEMEKIANELCLDPWDITPNGVTKKWAFDFIQSIPSLYTFWILQFRRDVQCQGKIKSSDINDITALSIAIPYCDIVVTEKMWADIAHKEKLDKIYNTTILSSLNNLDNYF